MKVDKGVLLIVIDSFCGAGGVTEGFHRAELNGNIRRYISVADYEARNFN